MFVEEVLDRQATEIGQRGAQSIVIPVPPGEPLQPPRHRGWKALPDDARRIAGDDGIRTDVLGHHGAGADHRAGPDGAPGKDNGAVPDPHVMADDDQMRAPPGEKVLLIPLAREISAPR